MEDRTVLIEDGNSRRGTKGDWVGGINRHLQNGTGNIELAAVDIVESIFNSATLLRVDLGCAIEGNDGTAILGEGFEGRKTVRTKTTSKLGRCLRRGGGTVVCICRRATPTAFATASSCVGLRAVATLRVVATRPSRRFAFTETTGARGD